jgi:hypothetical protein
MKSRQDNDVTLLTVIYNELTKRGALDLVPPDLRGDVIPRQVHEHELAIEGRWGASRDVNGSRERAAGVFDATTSMLVRLHHALLLAYAKGDERLAGFEPLGATQSPPENHGRLVSMIPRIAAALEAGELLLPPDLQPPALSAQAARHLGASKSKAGKVASRQVEGETLRVERRETRAMIGRLKSFVKAFYGKDALTSFGFNLPLPPRRPRLEGDPADSAPAAEPVVTA